MRRLYFLPLVALSACSPSQVEQANRDNMSNLVAPCVTEDELRLANASDAQIQEFKKEETEANREDSCG
jgi:hypothetical protein